MSSTVDDSVVVDSHATNLAFRAGQLFERLLVDRGVELASNSGSSIVTAEHVESCLDQVLFDHLLRRMRESSHDGTAGEDRVGSGESREAA
jgi:hypothetical protein